MKKYIGMALFIGILKASSINELDTQIENQPDIRLAVMSSLETDLNNICVHVAPFNADCNWNKITQDKLHLLIRRLNHESIRTMLNRSHPSENLYALSKEIASLLDENVDRFNGDRKKAHIKEIIDIMKKFWEKILFPTLSH